MNEILLNALIARIKAGHMTIEQAPIPYQEVVEQKLHVYPGRISSNKRQSRQYISGLIKGVVTTLNSMMFTQAEIQSISDKVDSILAALRSAKKYQVVRR